MKKIVVYTSIFGGYDNLPDVTYKSTNCDFICFTEKPIQSNGWKIIQVPVLYSDNSRNAKRYKILPHKYLSEYDISIYMDGNFVITKDINILIDRYLNNVSAAFFDHNQQPEYDKRNCIYKEADVILSSGVRNMNLTPTRGILNFKDNPYTIQNQMNRYKNKKYPENAGLICGGIILRKHNELDCIRVMEKWWTEIEYYSKRDQLSFNFVAWEEQFKFNYIPGEIRNNEYFSYRQHDNKK